MKIIIALITFFLFGCTNKDEQFFKYSLDDYTKNHPMNLLYKVDTLENRTLINCVYPYYEVVFFKDSINTINITISQKMYYFESELNENKTKKLKGYFSYKNQAIIVFDENNLSNNYLFTSLKAKVPDSLKYDFEKCNGQNLHNKNNDIQNYKLK